ncbi:MAG: DNA polymerase III subunit beta, partial [Methylococcales bacterium]
IEDAAAGAITVPARKFLDICRLLPFQVDIKIEQLDQDDKIKISSGRSSRFSLSSLPAENYPKFIETEFNNRFVISATKLKKALEKTIFCMANQDVRFYLNGLLLNISNQKLKMVTSDGHRLAIYEDNLQEPTGFEAKIVLPRKGVIELTRLLDDSDTEINIEFSDNNIRIYINNLIFSAKLVDAKYPDYTKVFNQPFLNTLLVPKLLLKETLSRVAILSNEKFKGVSFDISTDSIKISAHNPEHEEAEEDCLCEYIGDPLSIAFNVQYMLDAVSNLNSDVAALNIASNASTCFIEEPNQQSYKFIVMSMRL